MERRPREPGRHRPVAQRRRQRGAVNFSGTSSTPPPSTASSWPWRGRPAHAPGRSSNSTPPRRASRYFRYADRLRSIHPDAFGVLRRGDDLRPFFLEWERRAVRPVTMAARLAPYLRYYSSHRPTDDHGARPDVLVVFDDDIAQAHFLRIARQETARAGVELPLLVSHRELVEREGPLGRAWLAPGATGPVRAFTGR